MLSDNDDARQVPKGLSWTALGAVVIIAIAVAVTIRWGTEQSGSAADWVAGILTFFGIAIALYQSAIARRAAEKAEGEAQEASAHAARAALEREQDRWDLELARRIETELMVRRHGMEAAREILLELAGSITKFGDAVKDAAFSFEDDALRRNLSLGLTLHWAEARARIGIATLPIATTSFVHTLANEALPEIDELYERSHVLIDAKTPVGVTEAMPDSDVLEQCQRDLRDNVLSDFSLDREDVKATMIESMPSERPS